MLELIKNLKDQSTHESTRRLLGQVMRLYSSEYISRTNLLWRIKTIRQSAASGPWYIGKRESVVNLRAIENELKSLVSRFG